MTLWIGGLDDRVYSMHFIEYSVQTNRAMGN